MITTLPLSILYSVYARIKQFLTNSYPVSSILAYIAGINTAIKIDISLFPSESEYLNLSNKTKGPINCAADDLDLNFDFDFNPSLINLDNNNLYQNQNVSNNSINKGQFSNNIGLNKNFKNFYHNDLNINENITIDMNLSNSNSNSNSNSSNTNSNEYINALDDEFDNLNYKKRKLSYFLPNNNNNNNNNNNINPTNQEFWDVPDNDIYPSYDFNQLSVVNSNNLGVNIGMDIPNTKESFKEEFKDEYAKDYIKNFKNDFKADFRNQSKENSKEFGKNFMLLSNGINYGVKSDSITSSLSNSYGSISSSNLNNYEHITSSSSNTFENETNQEIKQEEKKKIIDLNEVNLIFDNYLLSNEFNYKFIPSQQHQQPEPEPQTKQQPHPDPQSQPEEQPQLKKPKLSKKEKITIYNCPDCDATFKVKGYLTRHMKKHNSSKAFVCPFYKDEESDPLDNGANPSKNQGTKCHPTGGFSRRDTFKTHLKALHFIYPPGTKSADRNKISGRCAGCFQFFENNGVWLVGHIEKGDCEGSV